VASLWGIPGVTVSVNGKLDSRSSSNYSHKEGIVEDDC